MTIGNPGRAVARGTITIGGQPLAGVRVTSDTDKYCFTDSNGGYALADLQSGTRTLSATLTGYAFTAGFTNPASVPTAGLRVLGRVASLLFSWCFKSDSSRKFPLSSKRQTST